MGHENPCSKLKPVVLYILIHHLRIMEQEGWDFNVTDYDNLNWEQSGNLPYRRHGKECILYHALLPRHPQWILLLDVSSSK